MARAPFQCLILPYIIEDEVIKYGVFKRSDHGFWQFISGGGEDNETPLEAAHRECFEEAEIPTDIPIYQMDSTCSIPALIILSAIFSVINSFLSIITSLVLGSNIFLLVYLPKILS